MAKLCFVVMGFHKKTDPNSGRTLDLDKTYRGIIKPAAETAGYECFRADEIQHAGMIDVPMYRSLLEADLVIADLSTLNANAFFELGVRYALRSRRTIVIAEEGFKNPFDVNHISIRHYRHDGEALDFEVVDKFRNELTDLIKAVSETDEDDSPVYTFLRGLSAPTITDTIGNAVSTEDNSDSGEDVKTPYRTMIDRALELRASKKFAEMAGILNGIKVAQGEDVEPFVLHQLALATYKSEHPTKEEALLRASDILKLLNPGSSLDAETTGLWGAIHKRLLELQEPGSQVWFDHLNIAIEAYERGHQLLNDYYNGINAAFLYDVRASQSTGNNKIADREIGKRLRIRALEIAERLLSLPIAGESLADREANKYWIEATKVEALFGLKRQEEALSLFADLRKRDGVEGWMFDTTHEQLEKLKNLLDL